MPSFLRHTGLPAAGAPVFNIDFYQSPFYNERQTLHNQGIFCGAVGIRGKRNEEGICHRMKENVYCSIIKKRDFWHLYPDCPQFKCLPFLRKQGNAEEAFDAGCSGLCPVCRARYEAEHPDPHPVAADGTVESTAVVSAEEPGTCSPVPDNKTAWKRQLKAAAIGAVVALVLASCYYNGRFKSDLENSRQEGYTTGYSEGTQAGHDAGYTEGYDAGHDAGYTEGSQAGYDTGYAEGKDSGYTTGHDEGYASGLEDGKSQGYDQGYDAGLADGKKAAAAAAATPSGSGSNVSGSTSSGNSGEKSVSAPAAQETSETVYITETGSKYHRAGCSYLKKSCISISLSNAKAQGYTPCSRCNPPA